MPISDSRKGDSHIFGVTFVEVFFQGFAGDVLGDKLYGLRRSWLGGIFIFYVLFFIWKEIGMGVWVVVGLHFFTLGKLLTGEGWKYLQG